MIVLAILTSAQVGLRNATLRATTWAIGQAVGWPIAVPIVGSLVKAGVIGLISGLIGASLAALVGDSLFGAAFEPFLWAQAVLLIVLSGLLAAVPAAVIISRPEPVSHLRGVGI